MEADNFPAVDVTNYLKALGLLEGHPTLDNRIHTARALHCAVMSLRTNLASLNIETEPAHTDLFSFPTTGTSCIPCSLKQVVAGRVDAFLFANLGNAEL